MRGHKPSSTSGQGRLRHAKRGARRNAMRRRIAGVIPRAVFVASWGLLGAPGASFGRALAAIWGLLGVSSVDWQASLGILEGFLGGKTPKMPSRTPKTSPRPPADFSKRIPETPKRRPIPGAHEEREKLNTLKRYPNNTGNTGNGQRRSKP